MSHRMVFRAAAAFACVAGLLLAQAPPGSATARISESAPAGKAAPPAGQAAPPEGSPVAKQPQVKSQEEANAVMAIIQAQDPDSRIKAATDLVAKFNDSEFKPLALFFSAVSYQQKGDTDRMIVYAERTLQADPEHYQAMLMLAGAIAQRTKEFDLDREEKLKAAEGYANKALEILKTAPRPNPQLTDAQWEMAKKSFAAQAHEAFGLADWARNQNDKAVEEFRTALSLSPDPSTQIRLAATYTKLARYDDAVSTLDQVLADPSVEAQIKKIAEAEKNRAIQSKQKGAEPAK